MNLTKAVNRAWFVARRTRFILRQGKAAAEDQTLFATGGWELFSRVHTPQGTEGPLPAVLIVPGLGASTASTEGFSGPIQVGELCQLGIVVMTLDLSGRGQSWGNDVYGGPQHQEDVETALKHLTSRAGVDPERVGVLSLSLGCAAVAGALVRPNLPSVSWWMDWEGPCDRNIITSGGTIMEPAMGHSLDDDEYWHPREAVRHVGAIGIPYLRYQSIQDHAQPGEFRHAIRMIEAAEEGNLPWFQINDQARCAVLANPEWAKPGYRHARDWIVNTINLLFC